MKKRPSGVHSPQHPSNILTSPDTFDAASMTPSLQKRRVRISELAKGNLLPNGGIADTQIALWRLLTEAFLRRTAEAMEGSDTASRCRSSASYSGGMFSSRSPLVGMTSEAMKMSANGAQVTLGLLNQIGCVVST